MIRFLTAWFGTRRGIALRFRQYELDLGERRLQIAGLQRIVAVDEVALREAGDALREAHLRIRQLELQLEPAAAE